MLKKCGELGKVKLTGVAYSELPAMFDYEWMFSNKCDYLQTCNLKDYAMVPTRMPVKWTKNCLIPLSMSEIISGGLVKKNWHISFSYL